MTRTEWTNTFIVELQRLRPHLSTEDAQRLCHDALALRQDGDPKASARSYHDSQRPSQLAAKVKQ